MFNAGVNNSEGSSSLRDKHLCAISEIIRNGGQFSVLANELAQLRLESDARVWRTHDVVVGFGQRQRAVDGRTKEQSRAARFAFNGEEQLQRLILPPLDELSALLDLPAALRAEEERRLRAQRDRPAVKVLSVSDEDREKVVDEMMRRYPGQSAPTENDALRAEQDGKILKPTQDDQHGNQDDVRLDHGQHGRLTELVLQGAPARSTLGGIGHELLILLQRTLDLQPLVNELSDLGARGDQRWKEVWRRLHRAIIEEQKMQGATLKVLASLRKDLSLKERVRMEGFIPPTCDVQEITRLLYRDCLAGSLYHHIYYKWPWKQATEAADAVGVDLGLPREEREEEAKVEENGRLRTSGVGENHG